MGVRWACLASGWIDTHLLVHSLLILALLVLVLLTLSLLMLKNMVGVHSFPITHIHTVLFLGLLKLIQSIRGIFTMFTREKKLALEPF